MKEAKKKLDTSVGVSNDLSISALGAFFVYLITGLFLAVGFWVARNKFSVDLVSDPSLTLFLLWSIEFPVVVIIYSFLRKAPEKCSCFRAYGRSILGLICGAFLNALGAISLGAPIGMQYLPRTVHWSFLMSVFTFVPATAVFGASWTDWHRLFASMKPSGNVEYMIFIPAYGTIIGGWFGAWPMPLDWERPWQEWPICVCYGAIGGYIVGQIVSLCAMFFFRKDKHLKVA
ncbi:phosphatidylinositol-glycan biosynthesis class F protein isoform X1 [Brassica napus]|uniref:phosphatidylinositol-glycan biosynthesis class F protein-like n=1 Tax=Brassica oleracea var. oleracea TaxID=109376 RepID=UPI0006A75205|nr:PREDICTED: phosphatidylinositol-glycan biosynthesis class F protein-like [Brassica oleracea var. oleracea]XP_013710049.1 phosphatidylinositol-glycan biosynthesis class F protein isoform X1 [Brassica napus]